MERPCFFINLFEGTEKEYDQRHDNIWPEMESGVAEAGFRNYSLFRIGTQVIGYAECDPDIRTVLEKMASFDVEHRWNASFANVIINSKSENEGFNMVPEVLHLKLKGSI